MPIHGCGGVPLTRLTGPPRREIFKRTVAAGDGVEFSPMIDTIYRRVLALTLPADTQPSEAFEEHLGGEGPLWAALLDVEEPCDTGIVLAPAHGYHRLANVEDIEVLVRRQGVDRAIADLAAAVADEDLRGPEDLERPGPPAVLDQVRPDQDEPVTDRAIASCSFERSNCQCAGHDHGRRRHPWIAESR